MPKGRKTGGRVKGSLNKITADVKAVAQVYTASAISTLVHIMRDQESPPQARVAAARELLDRGHGKAPATLAVTAETEHRFVAVMPAVVDDAEEWERQAQAVLTKHHGQPAIDIKVDPPKAAEDHEVLKYGRH